MEIIANARATSSGRLVEALKVVSRKSTNTETQTAKTRIISNKLEVLVGGKDSGCHLYSTIVFHMRHSPTYTRTHDSLIHN